MLVFEKELDQLIIELEKELEKLMKKREGVFFTGEIDKRVAKIRILLIQYHSFRDKLKTSPKSLRILHWLMSLISKILMLNNELDIKRISRPLSRRVGGKSDSAQNSKSTINPEFFDPRLVELMQKFLGNEASVLDSILSPTQKHHQDLLRILETRLTGKQTEDSLVIEGVKQLYLQQLENVYQQEDASNLSTSPATLGLSPTMARIAVELSIIAIAMELTAQIAVGGAKSVSYAARILEEGIREVGGHPRA